MPTKVNYYTFNMINIATSLTLSVLSAIFAAAATADCSHKPSIELSDFDGAFTFNDANRINGDIENIDKISKVEVYSNRIRTNHIVTKIKTTYKLKDGNSKTTISNGDGGNLVGSFVLDEGIYLKSVNFYGDEYVDWVQFCDTNGNCSDKLGGIPRLGEPENNTLRKNRSVIKAFIGNDDSGSAGIKWLGCYFEKNKLYSVEIKQPDFTVIKEARVTMSDSHGGQRKLDNRSGRDRATKTVTYREEVETNERTKTSSTVYQYDAPNYRCPGHPRVKFSHEFNGETEEFYAGSSWMCPIQEVSKKELTAMVKTEVDLVAPPQTLVEAEFRVALVNYEFGWEAQTICSYTFDPNKQELGEVHSGTMSGSHPFSDAQVIYSYEKAPDDMTPVLGGNDDSSDGFNKHKHYGCRKQHGKVGTENKDYELVRKSSKTECKAYCLNLKKKCSGFEHTPSSGRCEIWFTRIDASNLNPKEGTDCFISDKMEPYSAGPSTTDLKQWCMDYCRGMGFARRRKRQCIAGCRKKYDDNSNHDGSNNVKDTRQENYNDNNGLGNVMGGRHSKPRQDPFKT